MSTLLNFINIKLTCRGSRKIFVSLKRKKCDYKDEGAQKAAKHVNSIQSSCGKTSCMNYSLFDTKSTYAESVQGHCRAGGTRGSWGTRRTL